MELLIACSIERLGTLVCMIEKPLVRVAENLMDYLVILVAVLHEFSILNGKIRDENPDILLCCWKIVVMGAPIRFRKWANETEVPSSLNTPRLRAV